METNVTTNKIAPQQPLAQAAAAMHQHQQQPGPLRTRTTTNPNRPARAPSYTP